MGNSCTRTDDAADAEGRMTQPSSHTQSSPHRRSHVQPAQRMSRSGSVDVIGDEGGSRGQPQPAVSVLPASSAGMKGPSRTGGVQSPPRVASVHSIASATDPAMEQSNHLSHSKRSTIQAVDDGQVSLGSDTVEGARDRFSVSTATVGSLTGPTTGTSAQGASPTRSAAQPQAARRENQVTLSPSSPKLASPATAEGAMRYQSGSGTTAEEGGGGGGAQHQSLLRQDTTFTSNNDTAQPVAASSQVSFGGATLGDVPLITLADCDPGEESNRAATPRPTLASEAVEAMDKGMPEEIGAEQLLQSWLDEQLAVRVRRTPFPKGKNQSLSVSTSQRAGNHVGTLSVSSLYGLSGGEASGSTSHQAATAGAGAVMTQPSGMASRLASLADELVAEISSDKRRAAAAAPASSLQHSPKQPTDPPPPPQQLNQLPAEAFGEQSFAESFSVSPNTSHLQPKRRDVTEVILRNVNRRRSSGAPAISSSGSGLGGHPQGQGDSRAIIPRSDHNTFLDPAADGLGLVPTTTISSD